MNPVSQNSSYTPKHWKKKCHFDKNSLLLATLEASFKIAVKETILVKEKLL